MLSVKSSILALGTVQFGLNYGISNLSGKIDINQANLILTVAHKNHISFIDTAIAYGDSEKILGEVGVTNFSLITKLPRVPEGKLKIRNWAIENVHSSLSRLNVSSIYGLLLHKSEDFLGDKGIVLYETLSELKQSGLIKKIGVSIYDPAELDALDNQKVDLDIIQAPFNVFDRRLELSGWLKKLKARKIEIQIRSIFLQGLLLLTKSERPQYFKKWEKHFSLWDNCLDENRISATEACLGFVKSYPEVDQIIVGVTNENQLEEIISIINNNELKPPKNSLSISDQLLIDPNQWNK